MLHTLRVTMGYECPDLTVPVALDFPPPITIDLSLGGVEGEYIGNTKSARIG